jgi:two-component system response regulator ResD
MDHNQDRVLVVDDEERIRKLVRMYLERHAFVVDEADSLVFRSRCLPIRCLPS